MDCNGHRQRLDPGTSVGAATDLLRWRYFVTECPSCVPLRPRCRRSHASSTISTGSRRFSTQPPGSRLCRKVKPHRRAVEVDRGGVYHGSATSRAVGRWNGIDRDTIRDFGRGGRANVGTLASRSPARSISIKRWAHPSASINFITARRPLRDAARKREAQRRNAKRQRRTGRTTALELGVERPTRVGQERAARPPARNSSRRAALPAVP